MGLLTGRPVLSSSTIGMRKRTARPKIGCGAIPEVPVAIEFEIELSLIQTKLI